MKKFIAFILFLSILFLFSNTSYAVDQNVSISELDLTVKIPENYIVITQNTPANGTEGNELKKMGIALSDVQYLMTASNQHLDAIESSVINEITINADVFEHEIPELKNLNTEQKEFLMDKLTDPLTMQNLNNEYNEYAKENPDAAILVENAKTIYIGEEMLGNNFYLIFDKTWEQNGMEVYSKYYYTTTRNRGIGIQFISYDGPVTDSQTKVLRSVVDSMEFSSPESTAVLRDATDTDDLNIKALAAVITLGILIFGSLLFSWKKQKQKDVGSNLKYVENQNLNYKFCTKCGKQIPNESEYCRYCGNKVS